MTFPDTKVHLKLKIINRALAILSQSPIETLESVSAEQIYSEAQYQSNLHYDDCLAILLSSWNWTWAYVTEPLKGKQNYIDTKKGRFYKFRYEYPSDCQRFGKIHSDYKMDTRDTRVKYSVAMVRESSDEGLLSGNLNNSIVSNDTQNTSVNLIREKINVYKKIILTDRDDAVCSYIPLIGDESLFPTHFSYALSYFLASEIAPLLTAGDPDGLEQKALQKYAMALNEAKTLALIEREPEDEPLGELERSVFV